MKKIMIAAVALAYAAVAQAAQVNWALQKDSAKTFGNLTAYVVNGSDYSAVVSALTVGGESIATTFASYAIDSVALNSRGAGTSVTTGVTGTSIAWFIFDGDTIADGGTYSTTGAMDVSAYIYTPPESAPGELSFEVDAFTTRGASIGGSTPGPSPIPEPTSGLLVLLGVAGLALRRRA